MRRPLSGRRPRGVDGYENHIQNRFSYSTKRTHASWIVRNDTFASKNRTLFASIRSIRAVYDLNQYIRVRYARGNMSDSDDDPIRLLKQRRLQRKARKPSQKTGQEALTMTYDDMYDSGSVSKSLQDADKRSSKRFVAKRQDSSEKPKSSRRSSVMGFFGRRSSVAKRTTGGSDSSSSGCGEFKPEEGKSEEEETPLPLAEIATRAAESAAERSPAQQERRATVSFLGDAMSIAAENSPSRPQPRDLALQVSARQSSRSASVTSVDKVYGRLGRAGGFNDRFEMTNPSASEDALRKANRRGQSIYGDSSHDSASPDAMLQFSSVKDTSVFRQRRSTITGASRRRGSVASSSNTPAPLESVPSGRVHRRSISEDNRTVA